MTVTQTDVETFLSVLEATPRRLKSASDGIENARLHFKPDKKDWSANDILAHLRACADVWGGSMAQMIAQDHPILRYVSPRTWIRKTNYPTLEFHPSLLAFTVQREAFIQSLKALGIPDWSRGAAFIGTTLGREETVFRYARRMALHELTHCEQMEALLKSH